MGAGHRHTRTRTRTGTIVTKYNMVGIIQHYSDISRITNEPTRGGVSLISRGTISRESNLLRNNGREIFIFVCSKRRATPLIATGQADSEHTE